MNKQQLRRAERKFKQRRAAELAKLIKEQEQEQYYDNRHSVYGVNQKMTVYS